MVRIRIRAVHIRSETIGLLEVLSKEGERYAAMKESSWMGYRSEASKRLSNLACLSDDSFHDGHRSFHTAKASMFFLFVSQLEDNKGEYSEIVR